MIHVNSVRAFYLPRGHHAELELAPGNYEILADWRARHGVPDRNVNVELVAGQEVYLEMGNSLGVFFIGGSSVVTSNSSLEEVDKADLSNSREISRWERQWRQSEHAISVPLTLNERYELSVNVGKILDEFVKANAKEKKEIFNFLWSRKIFEDEILIAFEDEILSRYDQPSIGKHEVDFLAHGLKYIASSQRKGFISTLEKVRDGKTNKKLGKYAKKFLLEYYGLVESEKK